MHDHQTKKEIEEAGESMTSRHHPHRHKETTEHTLLQGVADATAAMSNSSTDNTSLAAKWRTFNEDTLMTVQEMALIFRILFCFFFVAFSVSFLILWKQTQDCK